MSEPRQTWAEADPNHVMAVPFVGVAVMFLFVRAWDWWVPQAYFHHGMALIGVGGVLTILGTMRSMKARGQARRRWVEAHGATGTAQVARVVTLRQARTHAHLQVEATITPDGGAAPFAVLHEQQVPLDQVARVSALKAARVRLHPLHPAVLVLEWPAGQG